MNNYYMSAAVWWQINLLKIIIELATFVENMSHSPACRLGFTSMCINCKLLLQNEVGPILRQMQ